jgi:nucleoside-diphosphate-sugar epimerase
MSPHVLVTGAAGYLGSILCEHLLDKGYKVTAVDNLLHGQYGPFHLCANDRFEFVMGDARDETLIKRLMKEADVLLPLAAIVGASACDRNPDVARTLNYDAPLMMNRLRSRDQLLVFPTTNSGYGTKSGTSFCTEETPLEPISLYGRTKVDAEAALLQSANVITLRLATVFGTSPRMRLDLLVNHFVHAAVREGYIVLFEKDFKRNYIHIRDVADCFIHCVENAAKMTGRPYNAGLESANLSKEELALKVKQYVPTFYIHPASLRSDPDKRNYIVSNERLKQFGFEAKRSLDEGIRELIKGYKLMPRSVHENG